MGSTPTLPSPVSRRHFAAILPQKQLSDRGSILKSRACHQAGLTLVLRERLHLFREMILRPSKLSRRVTFFILNSVVD